LKNIENILSMSYPLFKKGSLLSIYLQYYNGPINNIQGLCIKKKNQGNYSYFTISSIINNETIIHKFPLYSPYIKKIKLIQVK
jgi:ribosomal protein L19